MKEKPLTVEIRDDEIVISIGVGTMKFCHNNNGQLDGYDITDAAGFAKEVLGELCKEQEDGTTPVHVLFDNAFQSAIEDGAIHVTARRSEEG